MTRFKKYLVILIVSCAFVRNAKSEATREDMAKAANLMKQACLPKFKVSEGKFVLNKARENNNNY
jgi:hypothetical protein